MSSEALRRLVENLCESAERDADGRVVEVDDVSVDEAVLGEYRRNTWGRPGRCA